MQEDSKTEKDKQSKKIVDVGSVRLFLQMYSRRVEVSFSQERRKKRNSKFFDAQFCAGAAGNALDKGLGEMVDPIR